MKRTNVRKPGKIFIIKFPVDSHLNGRKGKQTGKYSQKPSLTHFQKAIKLNIDVL